MHRFAHFWLMVYKSFTRNRCPVRAAALAYTTLLALIPMLAVAISVSTSILKKQGEDQILHLVDKFIASVTPPATMETNGASGIVVKAEHHGKTGGEIASPQATNEVAQTETNAPAANAQGAPPPAPSAAAQALDTRKQVAHTIEQFIQNTSSGTWGVTGTVLLVFVAISMLTKVESTFNDIWGVTRGRSWPWRIVLYWGVITLGPLALAAAVSLARGSQLESTKEMIGSVPVVGGLVLSVILALLPVLLLWLEFSLFYLLIPNTKVQWQAALAGGLVAGVLWHLNNLLSVLYVSRVVTNSRIYGSMAMVPVFMVGLYVGWLILLFGAQVAYAYQNRAAYVQQKLAENINQRGKEFIALRVMACIGWRFQRGLPAATMTEIAAQLAVPTRVVQQVLQVLAASQVVVEAAGAEIGYVPARPLESVTCHDILQALRTGQGQEPVTSDEPARAEVYGEFQQILEAERKAAAAVTLLMMVNRVAAIAPGGSRGAIGGGGGAET